MSALVWLIEIYFLLGELSSGGFKLMSVDI
jgi:hypothetical protein